MTKFLPEIFLGLTLLSVAALIKWGKTWTVWAIMALAIAMVVSANYLRG